jgi:hypothetical protein
MRKMHGKQPAAKALELACPSLLLLEYLNWGYYTVSCSFVTFSQSSFLFAEGASPPPTEVIGEATEATPPMLEERCM